MPAVNFSSIKGDNKNFETDFTFKWRNIVKTCLNEQVARNPYSTRLSGVKEQCRRHFGYLSEPELKVVQDRISDRFRSQILSDEWDPWRDKLPGIFKEKEVNIEISSQAVLNFDSDGFPTNIEMNEMNESISGPKEETFLVQVISEKDGKLRMNIPGTPKDTLFVSLSDLLKSLAG